MAPCKETLKEKFKGTTRINECLGENFPSLDHGFMSLVSQAILWLPLLLLEWVLLRTTLELLRSPAPWAKQLLVPSLSSKQTATVGP